jgi:hypothetical protein
MDTYEPFKEFLLIEPFTFFSRKYIEYRDGEVISDGFTNNKIKVSKNLNNIDVSILNNTISSKITGSFNFDLIITLNDRLQLTIFPKNTNVEDVLFTQMKWFMDYTREEKQFTSIEPIVGHIFTEDGEITKLSFMMANPRRLIEFY